MVQLSNYQEIIYTLPFTVARHAKQQDRRNLGIS